MSPPIREVDRTERNSLRTASNVVEREFQWDLAQQHALCRPLKSFIKDRQVALHDLLSSLTNLIVNLWLYVESCYEASNTPLIVCFIVSMESITV